VWSGRCGATVAFSLQVNGFACGASRRRSTRAWAGGVRGTASRAASPGSRPCRRPTATASGCGRRPRSTGPARRPLAKPNLPSFSSENPARLPPLNQNNQVEICLENVC
jgi:hypothetical protein